jgi:hypothetical protein
MKALKLFFLHFLALSCFLINAASINGQVTFKQDNIHKKVDVFIDHTYFTSYLYASDLEKQVLYPIVTASGKEITRGYPINPRPFERTDHPHHVGLWFNFGDVNGLDFWNNSFAIKPEDKHRYGSIKFREIVETNPKTGTLITRSDWVNNDGEVLLNEKSTFESAPKTPFFQNAEKCRFVGKM